MSSSCCMLLCAVHVIVAEVAENLPYGYISQLNKNASQVSKYTLKDQNTTHDTRTSWYFLSIMGANESRVEQHDSPTDDSDDWKSRVEVKPSKQLVARLEQLQRAQDNTASFAEPSALEDDQRQQEEERGSAMQREEEVHARGVRKEENDDRVRELRAATNAESALLSKIISSVVVPKFPAERQVTFCSEESNAVIKCYQSQRSTGEELKCTDFVDSLEACTSNATRAP